MTEWQRVLGTQTEKPEGFDTTSSSFYVYQYKDAERVTITDDINKQSYEAWQYDERKLTREEYAVIIAEIQQAQIDKTRADVDYIATMADVDLGGEN